MSRRALAVLCGVLLVVAGCGQQPPPTGGATVVLAAARTGSPLPVWNETLEQRFTADAGRVAAWTFVTVDGRPSAGPPLELAVRGDNDLVREAARAALRTEAERRLGALRADDPEVDLLAALDLARRVLVGQPAPRTVVVLDSMLQTAGHLRFADQGGALLDADPVAVADRVVAAGGVPELRSIDVVLVGAGDTAGPQDSLPPTVRAALITIWTELLRRAGAAVTVVQAPVPTVAATGTPPVTPVPVAVAVPGPEPVRLPDSAVGFLPDRAVFRDAGLAAQVLAPFAARLAAGGVRAELTGTTSSAGTPDGRLALSRDRAAAVADLLQRGGAPPGSVRATGVGIDFPGFVPDRDPSGNLDPVLAARNRLVIIELVPVPSGEPG